MQRPKVLDLFAGSRSFSRQAEKMRMETFSIDIKPFDGISLVKDMEFVTAADIPWVPDIIWASPHCTSYSMAGIGHHRQEDGMPKSPFAEKSDRLVTNMVRLIRSFPSAAYYVENPRAMLRTMDYIKPLGAPVTVWYCRYGHRAAKPTDIWTNNLEQKTLFGVINPGGWRPRPECWNGNRKCHHEVARRGSRSGTQGLKNAYERSRVPDELCQEVLIASVDIAARNRLTL